MKRARGRHGVSAKKGLICRPAYGKRQSKITAEANRSTSPFSSVEELLATGFLEGAPVTYVFKKHEVELHGFIKGNGYLCGCSSCNYTQVLSANEFEKHSGVAPSFANDHIVLQNGTSLNEVVKGLIDTPLESSHEKLEDLTGTTIDSELYDAWIKGSSHKGSSSQELKQTRANSKLNQESPPDLRLQLQLDTTFQKKRSRVPRGKLRWSAPPTQDVASLATASPPRRKPKRAHDCVSHEPSPPVDKRQHLNPEPKSNELLHFSSHGQSSLDSLLYHIDLGKRDIDSALHAEDLSSSSPQNTRIEASESPGHKEEKQRVGFSPSTPYRKVEAGCVKKLDVKRFLSTGLLEGFPVIYTSKKDNVELRGIIKDRGYLCGCSSCNYSRVISALEFEKHAGAVTKNQNHHILLENGLSLYNLIRELKTVPLGSLSQILEKRIGCGANSKCYDLWGELYRTINEEVQETCVPNEENEQDEQEHVSKSHSVMRPPSEGTTDPAFSILADSSSMKQNSFIMESQSEENKSPRSPLSADQPHLPPAHVYPQQQNGAAQRSSKRRDHYLHDLIFKKNGLPNGTALAYIINGQRRLTGYKSGNGIMCTCCGKVISPSKFEAHAGFPGRRQPYHNIYTVDGGHSLHLLSLSLSKCEKLSVSENWCRICGDEEDLVACNGCTRSFHSSCLEVSITCDKWFCPYCEGSRAASTCTTSNTVTQSSLLRRVLSPPNDEFGGCVLCRDKSFSLGQFNAETIILCNQCEKEYHVGCLRHHGICDLKGWPSRTWFCSADCDRIHATLEKFVTSGPTMVPVSLFSKMEKKVEDRNLIVEARAHMQWQVLSGQCKPVQHKLLSEAIEVIRDAFSSILERQHDLIPAMVFGREIAGQGFRGMYCVVVTVKSVIVSVGILRIFGKDVAELPLVVTRNKSQGKGYFQILLSLTERLLSQLNVEVLTIPAADNSLSMWINKFGFIKMTDERIKKYANEVPILMFQESTILEKTIPHVSSPWS